MTSLCIRTARVKTRQGDARVRFIEPGEPGYVGPLNGRPTGTDVTVVEVDADGGYVSITNGRNQSNKFGPGTFGISVADSSTEGSRGYQSGYGGTQRNYRS